MRKSTLVLSIILTLASVSCDEKIDSNPCTVTDETDWINELKESMTNCTCEISIVKGIYKWQPVIFIAPTDPLCNSIWTPTLYNCDGKEIKSFTNSPADQKELRDKVTIDTVLYRCKA